MLKGLPHDYEQVKSNLEMKTLRIVEPRPTKDPWEKENMPRCKWTRVPGRPEEDMDNKSVISYFKKLKKDSCLPATQLRRVQGHAMWSVGTSARSPARGNNAYEDPEVSLDSSDRDLEPGDDDDESSS